MNWLAGIASKLGVEIYTGFAAKEIIIENNKVKGIKLGDKGLDKDKKAALKLCTRRNNRSQSNCFR